MKFTHREIEEDRYKPVGSLFLSLMDRDSMPPRGHREKHARGLYDRSLPNTPFSLYRDDPSRAWTPDVGRRHFPAKSAAQHDWGGSGGAAANPGETRRAQTASRERGGTAHAAKNRPDHLGSDMVPTQREPSPVRHTRYIREPRGDGADVTPIRVRLAGGGGVRERDAATPLRHRPQSARHSGHLSLHTLIPKAEPPPERPVPPPMVMTPRRTGIRMFPEKRCSSAVSDRRSGVKVVRPVPHWRSTTERQWDLLELGVGAKEPPPPRYRNQSCIGVGGGPVYVPKGDATLGGRGTAQPSSPLRKWLGRTRSATPQRRSYDIITGRPLPC